MAAMSELENDLLSVMDLADVTQSPLATKLIACRRIDDQRCFLYIQNNKGDITKSIYLIPLTLSHKIIIEMIPPKEHLRQDHKIKFHSCYLLQSIAKPRRTYFGYTVNPFRRLRQHNGEITGGAKHTRGSRPWRLICYITGFHTKVEGLQFEWRLHHPIRKGSGLKGRIRILTETSSLNKWTPKAPDSAERPLTVWWLQPGLQLPYSCTNLKEEFLKNE